MSFQVGDKIVYPNHGVGIIEQINNWNVGVTPQRFYLLKIYANSLRVMIPYA
ncbi:MAG: CarD family transcriptional regulator, partial [Acidobacteriota bacterium]